MKFYPLPNFSPDDGYIGDYMLHQHQYGDLNDILLPYGYISKNWAHGSAHAGVKADVKMCFIPGAHCLLRAAQAATHPSV